MRIGIDAKWILSGPVSGRIVIKNIIENLPKKKNIFLLIKKKEYSKISRKYGNNFNIIPIPFFLNNAFTNFFILPFYIKKLNLNVMIYQTYGSIFFKSKSLVYIYDLLFLDFPKYFTFFEKIYFFPILHILKFAKAIITISNSEKKRITSHIKKKNIKVVHCSADHLNKIKAKKPKTNFILKNYILYVGRLNDRKNIKILLNSFNKLINKDIKLIIVGNVSHKFNNFEKLIKLNNLKSKIKLIQNASDNNIKWLYKNAEIFCFPSYAEGFGMPPLEAMSQGCPVVLSDIPPHREICGNSALYFNPNDQKELIIQINKLLTNKKIKSKYILRGLNRYKKYNWKKSSLLINKIVNKYFI
jgi:glycosyltransferase involved in cell wall biosynthesis